MNETVFAIPAWLTPVILTAAVASAAATGALFKPGLWYRTLRKPAWTPPDWLFPVAWTILYVLMIVAAWMVTRTGHALMVPALALWTWQLVLNAVWSPVFFGLRRMGTGLVVILVFWVALGLTTLAFLMVSVSAGVLMLPYLAWGTYAAALNLTIWWMNPSPLRVEAQDTAAAAS